MGKFDSSKTRVAAVFDQLYSRDPSGSTWLRAVVGLGSHADVVASLPPDPRLVHDHGRRWGDQEQSLPAPLALLEHLVRNVDPSRAESNDASENTRRKRAALAARHASTIDEAVTLLPSGRRGRDWFVLEGHSRPDAILETEDLVICIEGKRTEAATTSHTTWMGARSQLLRHMDAASECYPGKRIIGLLIVEGDGGADVVEPSVHWMRESDAQFTPQMLSESLPHRSDVERASFAAGILGVTTWQAVCQTTGLTWPPSADVD